MAASVNSTKFPCQIKKIKQANNQNCSDCFDLESLSKTTCSTLKRNPKMELSKPDLITLLSYLEGELQARDIVIATLKCEKMKYMLKYGPTRSNSVGDPIAALCRDNFAAQTGSFDQLVEYEQLPNPLESLVTQQRRSLIHMAKIFKEAELRHKKVVQELLECQKKKLFDGISDDGLTMNGLGEEGQSSYRQDIDGRRTARKKIDNDLKISSEVEDKVRQKQIVLLLLAERKKIVMKYIEERKRSEDLAQILSEEKGRIDSMAEGLEEESKKSLQMEAELEKQIAQFDSESQILRTNLMKEEKRVRELESELEKVRSEAAQYEKQLTEMQQMAAGQSNTILHRPASQLSMRSTAAVHNNASVTGNVAKVVQPTATVSSVPVTGPTTGVARSIPSSQGIRGTAYSPPIQQAATPPIKAEKRPIVGVSNSPKPGCVPPSQAASATNGSSEKKPIVTRGAPPPVPPNKPILLPKKDAAFKRADSSTCNSDTVKSKKDIKICPSDTSDNALLQTNSETYSNVKAVTE